MTYLQTCKSSPSEFSIRPASSNPSAQYHLIFFITGNPGLISYYDTFLSTLHSLLSASTNDSKVFHVYGQSLAGFTDGLGARQEPFSIEEQINHLLSVLKSQQFQDKPYQSIILMGHSLGTYIILELISRSRRLHSPIPNIRAGVLLFATVTHLADSASGIKATALFRIPDFPRIASRVIETLLWPLPKSVVGWLVRLVTGMPEDSARVTADFLKADKAIWQALSLAGDELQTITEDRWDEEIWGIEHEDGRRESPVPELIFYFGEQDHWVANHTRDALIAARARKDGDLKSSKPRMMIDKDGVPHAFCLQHSELMAEKCKVWVEDIMSREWK